MNIAEFFVTLGFNGDKGKVDQFSGSLGALQRTISSLKVVAAAMAIDRFVSSAVSATQAVTNFNAQTGLSVDILQRWQRAGSLSNIALSFDEVANSVAALESNLAQIRLGGGNVAPFQLLGIDVAGRNAFQVLDQVREAIVGLDNATATNLLQQMGISPNMVQVLRLTREEFDKLGNNNFLSRDQRNNVRQMGVAYKDIKTQLVVLKDTAVSYAAPALQILFRAVSSITQGLTLMANKIASIKGVAEVLIPTIIALGVAFAPVTTAVIGLLLLLDDLATYMRGGDSVFGMAVDGIKKLGQGLKDNVTSRVLNPESSVDSMAYRFGEMLGAGARNAVNTFNNVFNINSSADANAVAAGVVTEQQRQLNHAMSDFNNGARN